MTDSMVKKIISTLKKVILFAFFLIISSNTFAQVKFEKGYFIDNDNNKIDCFIKNFDNESNPSKFTYKLSENESSVIGNIEDIAEFGIVNVLKYKRFTVNIERSTNDLNTLNYEKNSKFKKETLYLKQLVEGDANLYSYIVGDLKKYFFNVNGGNVNQLIGNHYLSSQNIEKENNSYKIQLAEALTSEDLKNFDFDKIQYNNKELMDLFSAYNKSKKSNQIIYKQNTSFEKIKISIRPGVTMSNVVITNANAFQNRKQFDFGTKTNFRLGAEVELVLPFNRNRWSVFAEPTLLSYKNSVSVTETVVTIVETKNLSVDYTSLDFPVGIRRSFFLNEKSKLYLNLAYVMNFSMNSKISPDNNINLDVSSSPNFAFGFGYNYKKLSIEFNYGTSRNITGSYYFNASEYKANGFVLGYRLW